MVLVSSKAGAQYDPYFSHYFDMQPSVNPAAAGKDEKLNIFLTYAMTMVGFENAPKTMMVSGDLPFMALNQRHGAGFQLMSDNIGLFTHQRISGQYSYRAKLLGGLLAGGIQAGLLTEKFRGSDVQLIDENDPVFSKSDIDGKALDLAAGLYYSRKNWWAGISAQHLTFPTITLGETNELKIDASYYAMGGMDFQLPNPLLKVKTSAIVRSDLVAYRADVTGRLAYNYEGREFYGGLSYSPTNSATILLGGQFQGVTIAYSFEIFTNGLGVRNGSHELYLGYQMDMNLKKRGRNYHQTTRTL